ncbi:MAG TPA: glycosyltransferase family 39 protein [Streptosporangiaceae bacterium]|nr:glycosyltransferase family 39 protein [Streptosporangiaceae bacterium]
MATYAKPHIGVAPILARPARRSWPWPIVLVLALQALTSLVALHNTAFQDEGLYLYAGRQIIHHWAGGPAPPENYAFYFSGYPYFYPVIGGFLDMIGGLQLARSFSLMCMLGVTTIAYYITGKLFHRRAAIFAAAVYASTGVVMFVGRLATFDSLCLLLIATSTAFSVCAGMSKRLWWALMPGPVIVLAILAKYAALLFVPSVFGLLACLSISFLPWRAALLRLFLAGTSFALSLGIADKTIDKAAFHAISGSTTSRAVSLKGSHIALLIHVLHMGGVVYVTALAGLVLTFRLPWRFRTLAVLLFGSSWLVPAYHIYKLEPTSLDKHIAYAMFFIVPLAGYALAWLSGYERQPFFSPHRGYWVAGVAVVLAMFTLGLGQSRHLYAEWADTSGLSTALHTQIRDGSGRILAEDVEVSRYDAMDITEPWQWYNFYYPYYVDPKGHFVFGNDALIQGVKNRYYSWVELSFTYLPQPAYFAAGQMAATRNYDLVAVVLFSNSYGKGHFYLFRSAIAPGQGNFTSLAQLKTNDWGS